MFGDVGMIYGLLLLSLPGTAGNNGLLLMQALPNKIREVEGIECD